MKLLPVPFAAGMDQSTDPAFMAPGGLTLVENLRPTRAGRLAKRPAVATRHSGETSRVVQGFGAPNLVAASSDVLASSSVDGELHHVGTLPAGTPLGMWSRQHTGTTQEDSPEVEVLRVSSAIHVPSGMLAVAYEFLHGSGFGQTTRLHVRLIDRSTGHVWSEQTILGEKPMFFTVGGALRLAYLLDGITGIYVAPISTTGSVPLGSSSNVGVGPNVTSYSVAAAAGGTQYYGVRVSSTGTLRIWQVGANNLIINQEEIDGNLSNSTLVDVCVGPDRVWVVWSNSSGVFGRGYALNLSSHEDFTLHDSGQSNYGQPFAGYVETAGFQQACALWYCDDTTMGPSTLNAVLLSSGSSWGAITRSVTSLRPQSRPFVVRGAIQFVAAQPAIEAPNHFRVCRLATELGGSVWKALSDIELEGQAYPHSTAEWPSDVSTVSGSRLTWSHRSLLRTVGASARQYDVREWEFDLGGVQSRQFLDLTGSSLIPGGELVAVTAAEVYEAGFLATPRVVSVASSGNNSPNIPAGLYQYVVVYESVDPDGRLRLSPPSPPVSFTAGGTTSNKVTVTLPPLLRHRRPFAAHLYRTLVDGTVFYRVTTLRANTLTALEYIDTVSNTDLAERPILYTEGGVLPYDPAPASTFGAIALGRIWLGGLFERSRVVCSTDIVPGEMPGFPLDPTHWLDFPDEVTGLAQLDGDLAVFTRSGIWVVSGDGPSRTGEGGFMTPRRVATDLGCVDWRSVVSTTLGVFYQSRAGIMLLPGGAPTPLYIGQAVADELAARPYVVDASVSGEGDSAVARFVLAESPTPAEPAAATRVIAFSLRARAWSVDTYAATDRLYHLGNWRDANGQEMAVLGARNLQDGVLAEESTAAEYPPSRVLTGEIAPFGFGAEFRVSRVWLRLTNRGAACTVTVRIVYDDQLPTDPNLDHITLGIPGGGVFGQPVRLEWRPRQAQCKNVRFLIDDSQNGPASSRGVDYLGLVLEAEAVGAQQLQTANRR